MLVRRITLFCALFSVLLFAVTATAQTPGDTTPRIAQGVSAGGVDLSGLTVDEATAKLTTTLSKKLSADVVLGAGGVPFRLTAAAAKFKFDATQTARNALATPAPPPNAAGGVSAKVDVPLVLSHSAEAVKVFVADAAKKLLHPARNATLRITLKHMVVRRSRAGLRLDSAAVEKLVNAALDDANATRILHSALLKVRAKVNTLDLARNYATVITVEKATRTLRLFKHLKIAKRYGVAIGQPAYPTPAGLFHIQNKQINPTWSVPNSPWAGELAGTTVEGGSAANPLKARWMGITDGVGIHGTGEDWSIGQAASHGCLRMHVWDVEALYPRVPIGTPVLIK